MYILLTNNIFFKNLQLNISTKMKNLTPIVLGAVIFAILVSGCIEQTMETEKPSPPQTPPSTQEPSCLASCDDENSCTKDYCSIDTNYECKHDVITPCCGNNACEPAESYESCPKDCKKPVEIPVEANETNKTSAQVNETLPGNETPIPGSEIEPSEIKISAFNMHLFGEDKGKNDKVMDVLVKIAHEFDIMFAQEMADPSDATVNYFLNKINAGGHEYNFACSVPLGRSNTMEEYCYFWNTKTVRFIGGESYVYNDIGNIFEREPYIASFKSGNFDFILVGIRTKPNDATAEIANLASVVTSVLTKKPGEKDIIVLGDLSADGSYFNENEYFSPLRSAKFQWVITNDMNTTTIGNYTYDRMIMMDATYNYEYVKNSAGVLYFDKKYGITDRKLIEGVSDHYPIYAEFRTDLKDDD